MVFVLIVFEKKRGLAKASNAKQSLAKLAVSDSVSVSVSSKEDVIIGFGQPFTFVTILTHSYDLK